TPQMYQRDSVAYESLMLSTFSLWYNQFDKSVKIPKINQIFVGFSRDGFHWDRANRDPFIPIEREMGVGNPEFGYLRPAGGGCVIVGEELYFYYEGTSGKTLDGKPSRNETMTINLAKLRRDGFASMEASDEVGVLETRPVTFSGKHLFVNVEASQGELKVGVIDLKGDPIEPFTLANCVPVQLDETKSEVRWAGGKDLGDLKDKPVRFRFHLTNGALYAFWVSTDESGASNGYVASGGPGFDGPRDAP
ncbi:MAG: glycosyl hydrolase family 32, partial [Verrucomicrobiota bacterium]